MSETNARPLNFIEQIIEKDLANGLHEKVVTRFPPEPNGFLHIGHAKSICLNFGLLEQYTGYCNLRFDDTNPAAEEQRYIDSIKEDVSWLGYEWEEPIHYASDYFGLLYELAGELIKKGLAYVDSQTPDIIRESRGSFEVPGQNSPYRERSVEENLALFEHMRAGEFDEGECVLRAKIDMAAPNMNMRDPVIYRIRKIHHHQTGDQWCIYPMYDFTHPLSDAIEGITHSLCTLEFEDHRPFYDWVVDALQDHPAIARPRQYEFARLEMNYTVTSKRKLKQLVDEAVVEGWDDPRMPTISGMRRRGYTAHSIRHFCKMIGVTKSNSVTDVGMLEHAIRDDLNQNAPRRMCVVHPLKLTIINYPEGKTEQLEASNHPQDDTMGTREIAFSGSVYIDRDDFRLEANKKYKRLVLGKEVRLRNSYVVKAVDVVKDANDEVIEVLCEYDDQTLGKNPEDRKVKGVIHWVDAASAVDCELRQYDRLFTHESPGSLDDFLAHINPQSLTIVKGAKAEASLVQAKVGMGYQFEREGYYCIDSKAAEEGQLVFNQTIGLRDTWSS